MSTSAIVMMVLSTVLVWGGLIAAVVNLLRSPAQVPPETHRDL